MKQKVSYMAWWNGYSSDMETLTNNSKENTENSCEYWEWD